MIKAIMLAAIALTTTPAVAQQSADGARFVWADLVTDQPLASERFYTDLFGWSFARRDSEGGEWIIRSGERELGVMVDVSDADSDAPDAQWISVLVVDDADASAAAWAGIDGEIVAGPAHASEEGGRYVVVRDGEGALLTLYSGTVPNFAVGTAGQWGWFDLFTPDQESAERFLNLVAGLEAADAPGHENSGYRLVGNGDRARGGLVPIAGETIDPAWLPYVAVTDMTASIVEAESLGATLVARSAEAAILLDPSLAAFGLVMVDAESGS